MFSQIHHSIKSRLGWGKSGVQGLINKLFQCRPYACQHLVCNFVVNWLQLWALACLDINPVRQQLKDMSNCEWITEHIGTKRYLGPMLDQLISQD